MEMFALGYSIAFLVTIWMFGVSLNDDDGRWKDYAATTGIGFSWLMIAVTVAGCAWRLIGSFLK